MKNFKSIESLRAWMAWWVVLAHALQYSGLVSKLPAIVRGYIGTGSHAVSVFIIVSGFVITHLLYSRREKYVPYITRRAYRIIPIYNVCLVFSIATASLYAIAFTGNTWTVAADARLDRILSEASNFNIHIALHALLMHGVVPDSVLPFASSALLAPAWSLSLEWQFYLVAPFVIVGMIRFPLATSVVLLAVFVAISKLVPFEWDLPSFLPLALPYFLVGIVSRIVLQSPRLAKVDPRYFGIVIVLLFVTGDLPLAIWTLFFLLMLVESGRMTMPRGALGSILNFVGFNQSIATAGKWSYSTYLIHVPIFAAAVAAGRLFFGWHSQATTTLLILASLPIVVIASSALFGAIETPFNHMGAAIAKAMTGSKGPLPPAGIKALSPPRI